MKFKDFILDRGWVVSIGYVIAIGFINNLLIAPFFNITLIDWGQMATALGVLLGISGTRDYLTRNKGDAMPSCVSGKGWKRMWIPIVGWTLFFGYFINCVIAPYFSLQINDWLQLNTVLTVMLGISGAREVVLLPDKEDENNESKTETPKNN